MTVAVKFFVPVPAGTLALVGEMVTEVALVGLRRRVITAAAHKAGRPADKIIHTKTNRASDQ